LNRADRFVRIYTGIGMAGGLVFLIFGTWLLWIAQSSVLALLGLLTLTASLAARREHERLMRQAQEGSDHGHRPLAEAIDGGGVDAGGGDEDSERLG